MVKTPEPIQEYDEPVRPAEGGLVIKRDHWVSILALAGAVFLMVFQAYAFSRHFNLSLGPRVILEPWLLRHGYSLYRDIVDVHSPLMPLVLSWLAPLAPDGLSLAKAALLSLVTLTTVLTFIAGWRKIGPLGGLWAVFFFVLWSPSIGFGKLWYETFLGPIYLVWLIAYQPSAAGRSWKPLVLFGLTGGVVALIKQPAVLAFLVFAFWLVFTSWRHRRSISKALSELVVIGLSAAAPLAVFLLWQQLQNGSINEALHWIIGYHLAGGYQPVGAVAPTIPEIGKLASCFLLAPAAVVCAIDLKRRGDEAWLVFGAGLLLLVAGAATAYPRFEFFHLQAVLPAAALLSAMTLAHGLRAHGPGRSFALGTALALSLFWLVVAGVSYSVVFSAERTTKVYEYSDLAPLAKQVRAEVRKKGCVYIFPDDEASANLYYLLKCKPPKFWVLHYSWNLSQPVRERIIATLEQDPPEWVAWFPDFWGAEEAAPEVVGFLQEHYDQVATLNWAQGDVKLLRRVQ